MKSLLITGANGFLGSNSIKLLKNYYNVSGLDIDCSRRLEDIKYYEIDITDKEQVQNVLNDNNFDIILHCAAMVNPDICENNYNLARRINAIGTRNLIEKFKGLFIYISTDMLFDGSKGNYTEEDIPDPINNYGKTKLEGEKFVQQYSDNYLILRTNFFGWNHHSDKHTFAEWVYYSLKNNKTINLFYDYIFCPIYIYDFIDIINKLINRNICGIYNVVGDDCISKLEFGYRFADKFKFDKNLINSISIDEHNFIAKRPKNMSLSTDKLKKLGISPSSFESGLNKFYKDIHRKRKVIKDVYNEIWEENRIFS